MTPKQILFESIIVFISNQSRINAKQTILDFSNLKLNHYSLLTSLSKMVGKESLLTVTILIGPLHPIMLTSSTLQTPKSRYMGK